MKTTRTINAVIREPWAATSEEIEKVWMVVNRLGDPSSLRGRADAELDKTGATIIRNGVAVVSVTGPLVRYAGLLSEISGATSYSRVAKDLGEALRSPKVKKIILDINSGGGTVVGVRQRCLFKVVSDSFPPTPCCIERKESRVSTVVWGPGLC